MSTAFDKRLEPWFGERRWRVRSEVTGELNVGGVDVVFDGGEFRMDQPGMFVTPFGHSGRRGYLIIETDASGRDIADSEHAFGEAVLRRASAAYGTISGLPPEEA